MDKGPSNIDFQFIPRAIRVAAVAHAPKDLRGVTIPARGEQLQRDKPFFPLNLR